MADGKTKIDLAYRNCFLTVGIYVTWLHFQFELMVADGSYKDI